MVIFNISRLQTSCAQEEVPANCLHILQGTELLAAREGRGDGFGPLTKQHDTTTLTTKEMQGYQQNPHVFVVVSVIVVGGQPRFVRLQHQSLTHPEASSDTIVMDQGTDLSRWYVKMLRLTYGSVPSSFLPLDQPWTQFM